MSDTVNLTKGGNVNLTKAAPGVSRFILGLGWNAAAPGGAPIDLDAAAYPCITDANNEPKVASPVDKTIIYFGNLLSQDNAIQHGGDNLTGDGDGDDERILIDTYLLTGGINNIVLAAVIFKAAERNNQTFGLVNNAYIRIYDAAALEAAEGRAWNAKPDTGTVLTDAQLNALAVVKYDLQEDFGSSTVAEFGSVYLKDGDWKFRATGVGSTGDINTLLQKFLPAVAPV